MKIFGFSSNKESKFVNITCNLILGAVIVLVFALSIFSPVSTAVSSTKESAIYSGDRNSKNVSLMVNVYWGTEFLDDMLKVLKDNDVKTTFFVGGYWVAKNNDMLRKIYADGHEIGNHGYNHKDHAKLSAQQNQDEIYITDELVRSIINYKMNLFAPPSGSYNDAVLKVASSLNYKTIMWTRDTVDWRDKDENLIYSRAVNKTMGGDLILMHPTQKTLLALDKIIKALKEKGLNPTTVSKTLGLA